MCLWIISLYREILLLLLFFFSSSSSSPLLFLPPPPLLLLPPLPLPPLLPLLFPLPPLHPLLLLPLLLLLLLLPISLCPGCTSALGLLYNPKYSNQYRLSNPVSLIKRQRSLNEAVLISFGSTSGFPKTLQCWRANALQQQIIFCAVSISFLHNLQVGFPSNRLVVYRCPLTGACPVRITTIIYSWCMGRLVQGLNLSITHSHSA